MADDISSREQRLRKEAELQSLYVVLANYREREASYIEASAAIPELLINQINETRHNIANVEDELASLADKASESKGVQLYRHGFEAELAGDYPRAIKSYRSAGRYGHPDASPALRSVRYLERTAKTKVATGASSPASFSRSKNLFVIGLVAVLIIILVVALVANPTSPNERQGAIAVDATTHTATPSSTPASELIIPATATPFPSATPTATPVAPSPAALPPAPTGSTETPIPTPTPTLRAAPRIIEPKNGLVWGDGAIVFEFVDVKLADNELYCLNRMKGYDITNTENWSHEPRGNNLPSIAIEPNVFRVAKAQGMRCIRWSAALGRTTCDNIISENTEERVIALPGPCDFD